MFNSDENNDAWDQFRDDHGDWDYSRGEGSDPEPDLSGFTPDMIENMTDEEWAKHPKRWSTMLLLSELNAGRQYEEAQLVQAALAMSQRGEFHMSWSEKFGECIFWPASIPLSEVKSEVV